jgi:lincosamide nucleotidyltransferase A/C/D/E
VQYSTVLELIDLFESSGVEVWIDGGWGVDALIGRQTRPHDDLDLVVDLAHAQRIQELLGPLGFTLEEDHLPVRFVVSSSEIGRVDFHTVTFDADGGGVQPQPGGGSFRYPPEGFVSGSIDGRSVRCVSAEVQVLCHLGYEPKDKDVDDLLALHGALGIDLPARYQEIVGKRTV